MPVNPEVLARIDARMSVSEERLVSILKIPSISSDKDYRDACATHANILGDMFAEMGFEVSIEPTLSHPIVLARRMKPGAPHVAFYGHYDVQPIDPANKWKGAENWNAGRPVTEHPAFNPTFVEVDGQRRVIARGASDNKGPFMTFVEACRALIEVEGELPVSVTLIIEGAEECGSTGFDEWMEANKRRLAADVALVCDTGMWDRETPWITTSLRGIVYLEVTVTASGKELHSGVLGGGVPNPNNVLIEILAGLHDSDRRITLPGFYDGVREPSSDQLAQWNRLEADAHEKILKKSGTSVPFGEKDRLFIEMIQSRPTCDVNGFKGGLAEPGITKTAIPPSATAHVSFRLVGDQDPVTIARSFEAYARERAAGCTIEIKDHGGAPAVSVPTDGIHMAAARQALVEEWGKEVVEVGLGGSVPPVGTFKRVLGLDALLIGFALVDDGMHGPNEKYEMSVYRRGIRSWARVLSALGAKTVG